MAKFSIPRVVRPVDLGAYTPEMKEALGGAKPIWMWLNPTKFRQELYRALLFRSQEMFRMIRENREYLEKRRKENESLPPEQQVNPSEGIPYPKDLIEADAAEIDRQMNEWWADTWSQGPDGTHWTPAEVEELSRTCAEQDAGLWDWLHRTCWTMVREYREHEKKV